MLIVGSKYSPVLTMLLSTVSNFCIHAVSGNLFPVHGAQFQQVYQQRQEYLLPCTGNTTQQVVLPTSSRTAAHLPETTRVRFVQLLLKLDDMTDAASNLDTLTSLKTCLRLWLRRLSLLSGGWSLPERRRCPCSARCRRR